LHNGGVIALRKKMPSAPLRHYRTQTLAQASHESRILWHSQFAVPSLERLLEHPAFEVLAVVTQPDKRGRGNQTTPSPVKTVALTHHLPSGNLSG